MTTPLGAAKQACIDAGRGAEWDDDDTQMRALAALVILCGGVQAASDELHVAPELLFDGLAYVFK